MEVYSDKIFYQHEPETDEVLLEALPPGPQTAHERALFQGLGRSGSTGKRGPSGLPILKREIEMKEIMERGDD